MARQRIYRTRSVKSEYDFTRSAKNIYENVAFDYYCTARRLERLQKCAATIVFAPVQESKT